MVYLSLSSVKALFALLASNERNWALRIFPNFFFSKISLEKSKCQILKVNPTLNGAYLRCISAGRVATRNLKVPMKINEKNLAVKLGMPTDRIMKEVGKQLKENWMVVVVFVR